MGNIMTNMRQTVANPRESTGTRTRQRIGSVQGEVEKAVFSRLAGAAARAAFVVVLITTPSILLTGTHPETSQIVVLVALVAAVFTFLEYNSTYPSLIEFRDAPPFNRTRFIGVFACVFVLTLVCRGKLEPTTLSLFLGAVADRIAQVLDFPYSPIRLMVLAFSDQTDQTIIVDLRSAAAVAYTGSILTLSSFVLSLRMNQWPTRWGGFNVWTNMPTFDPTAGGDVVYRLQRDGQINLILGFLLPFLIPAAYKLASGVLPSTNLSDPHSMIWMVTAWAFLPASLLMRGIAMGRVSQLIEAKRKRVLGTDGLQPASA